MTGAPERSESAARSHGSEHELAGDDSALGPAWRARAEIAQQAVLPTGRVVATCGAPFGDGGLGRHLEEIDAALDRLGADHEHISSTERDADRAAGRREPRRSRLVGRLSPLARRSPGWRLWATRTAFDAYAAARLPKEAEHLIAFNRQALAQLRAARALGYRDTMLMTGSPHVRRVARQHALAYRAHPIEPSFGTHVLRRYLVEYERADRICVASAYTRDSFIEHGVPDDRLALFPLTPHPRYAPSPLPASAGTFDVLYIGSLSVAKGVPLLIDAFRRLAHTDMRLLLIGGAKTRAMVRFLREAQTADARILITPGDPLPHLQRARLCVHPTYEDGFAYAPAEAIACGVPVLVSEDTGMKDLIVPGRTGVVLPTGDADALSEAIDAVYRRELLRG